MNNSKNINNNITAENHDILKYLKHKSPKMILESLRKTSNLDIDSGTMLDETNIL